MMKRSQGERELFYKYFDLTTHIVALRERSRGGEDTKECFVSCKWRKQWRRREDLERGRNVELLEGEKNVEETRKGIECYDYGRHVKLGNDGMSCVPARFFKLSAISQSNQMNQENILLLDNMLVRSESQCRNYNRVLSIKFPN